MGISHGFISRAEMAVFLACNRLVSQSPVCHRKMRRGPGKLGSDGLPIIEGAASSRPAEPLQQQPLLDSGTPRSDGSSAAPTLPPRKTTMGCTALTMPTLPLPKPLSESLRPLRGRSSSRAEEGDLEESSTRSDGATSPAQDRPSSTPAR
jgi:hypothetical protein